MSLNLFIIGPSGCGKSTQAKLIAEKYNLTHYSTGQIFRDEMASGSELGIRAKSFIDKGELCPDDLVLAVVQSSFAKVNNQNFILDGTPRRLDQALEIQKYLQDNHPNYPLKSNL
jgi:adenylate kinase